jgi:hypothetical protein
MIEIAAAAISGSVALFGDARLNLSVMSTGLLAFLGLRVCRRAGTCTADADVLPEARSVIGAARAVCYGSRVRAISSF